MRHFKTKKGAFKQQFKKWGDLVMFDFVTLERVGQLGTETDANVFVVRDIYSGVKMAYPTSDGSADEFMGRRKIRVAYGDYALQFAPCLSTARDHV